MSRSKRFISGLLSSYAAIGINILYTLASVPLALHYLNKEEFGVWALVTQLSGYLMLLEFGMGGSVARFLADHKDHMEDGIYGSILRTGGRVFAIQGVLVAVLGLALAWFAPPLLRMPTHLHQPFAILMAAQALLSGARLSLGALASPLWCHQRLDLSNLSSSLSLIGALVMLWIGFHLGWHLYSLTISTAVGSFIGSISIYLFCHRLSLYPPREHRGNYDQKVFRELIHFGSSLFLMNLGSQLTSASQVVIVSRLLGMEAAATWSISTKIFNMAQQFVSRILDSSAGGLAEMVVREETAQLQKRFKDLVSISAVMAVAASAAIALTNGAFVQIWTAGNVIWNPWNDLLLAFVLYCTAVTRCHTGLVGISKQIRNMRFVYLLEGLVFISLSICIVPWLGLAGLLIAALGCNIAITGTYGIQSTAVYFGISWLTVIGWVARPTAILLFTTGLFAITQIPVMAGYYATPRLLIGAGIYSLILLPALWFFGISLATRLELTGLVIRTLGLIKPKLRLP